MRVLKKIYTEQIETNGELNNSTENFLRTENFDVNSEPKVITA